MGVTIAGHGRVLAARKLGLERVPVVIVNHLSDSEKRAYALADNRLALNAEWDEDLLKVELRALAEEGFDLSVTGFNQDELDQLVHDLETSLNNGDEDAVPEQGEEPVTVPGDVWVMASHRLLCADATQHESFERLLHGEFAAMVFGDLPYNVNYSSAHHSLITNDNLGDGFEEFLSKVCSNMLGVTKGSVYICMSVFEPIAYALSSVHSSRRSLVHVLDLGKDHVHVGPLGLPATIRTHSLRLARRRPALLVRSSRSRRSLANRQTAFERPASYDETSRTRRARGCEQQPPRGASIGSLCRIRIHSDCLRENGPKGSTYGSGKNLLRRDCQTLASLYRQEGRFGTRRQGV